MGIETWEQAERVLPDLQTLRDLALDPATHLPEPRKYRDESPP